ncbi:MAG: glycine dehydrogenase subunit 2 [Deltaproteobacteria bacterium]|nr:MAG: glycine dehydrogenase subunit 2 [Deltaproteobacteria bacterium]
MKKTVKIRKYHSAVWNNPIIMEMGTPGERGILVPRAEEEVKAAVGDAQSLIPEIISRQEPPRLPEVSQPQIIRHYEQLSQQTLGMEINIDAEGTATMKYSPKVHEAIVGSPQMADVHPLQDENSIQGILEIAYKLSLFLKEISGIDQFVFHPAGGAHATYTNACVLRAYHAEKGELDQRSEVITTIFSHPCNAATAATAGFKVITLMPDKQGYPDLDAFKAAISEKTAGLMITNPEDTGIYNPRIDEFVKAAHDVGALCFYDQANANGIMGITRAREAGFDACHFNLHKTFSSPHGSFGPGCAAYGVREELAKYLPKPVITFDGEKYHLDDDRPDSIGKIREFFGNMPAVLRAYAFIMGLGAEGLKEVSRSSVMNNNYLGKLIMSVPGVVRYYAEGRFRLEQTRYSFEKLKEDTGLGTDDVQRRIVDFGLQAFFRSHHPWIVPEPFTTEFCESYSKYDCDYWASVLQKISDEAYHDPDIIRNAPHKAPVHQVNESELDNPDKWAMTWRAYLKKGGKPVGL